MNKLHRVKMALGTSIVVALALLAPSVDLARADAVDDVLASQFQWREAHPVSKARMRVIVGGGAPVGWYYLDLRATNPTEVSILSLLLGKSELVMRTVTDGTSAQMFLNEDVYLNLDQRDMSILGGSGFWAARDVAEARAALSGLYDIKGTVARTVDQVSYTGIQMELSQDRWRAFRATVGPELMANMVPNVPPDLTIFFDASGELHSLVMEGPDVNVEVLFYDWTDLPQSEPLAGLGALELEDVRQPPHARQEQWKMPLDEALIKYITRLTQ